jgi:hypothetical protein
VIKENVMKVMQSKTLTCLTATVLSASLLGVAVAQQDQFPREREQAKSCAEVDWNKDMTINHPRLTEACREVVIADGVHWARFEAKFARVEPDGSVSFSIRDSRDRPIEEVTLQPAAGQVAYIDNRATPFTQLRRDQLVNLYVPEGTYGFVTQPGAPREQIAVVTAPASATATGTDSGRRGGASWCHVAGDCRSAALVRPWRDPVPPRRRGPAPESQALMCEYSRVTTAVMPGYCSAT